MAKYGQPVMSRETRLLLVTIVVSIGALWLLARLRFQEKPPSAAPVVPVLAQLRPQSSFNDLATSLSQLRPGVGAAMAVGDRGMRALRISEDAGIGVAASRFQLVRLPQADVPSVTVWTPRIVDYPRYLVAADFVEGNLSLRPVFVGSLAEVESRVWNGSIWRLPPGVTLAPGTFVFTTEGLLAGVTVEDGGALSLVPGGLLLERAHRLAEDSPHSPGHLGLTVQETPLGMAIAWVDPGGPSVDTLGPTDIIEAVNGQPVTTISEWHALAGNIVSGNDVKLRVRSGGQTRDIAIVAAALLEPPEDPSLGLRLRNDSHGVEVLGVEPRSRADRAGIRAGDVVTMIGGLKSPTAPQVRRVFDEMREGEKRLAAVTRGDQHHVVVLEKMVSSEGRVSAPQP